mmetsp:Transcript_25245/g.80254  ORF Transcript_25245/g.80254 Transcript_25245/m.80254 type:complete len:92 (+) Transcript_25245:219-494(+)
MVRVGRQQPPAAHLSAGGAPCGRCLRGDSSSCNNNNHKHNHSSSSSGSSRGGGDGDCTAVERFDPRGRTRVADSNLRPPPWRAYSAPPFAD